MFAMKEMKPQPNLRQNPPNPRLARKCTKNCPLEEDKPLLQRRASTPTPAANEAPPIVHEVLRSPGQPLDESTRSFMEPRFNQDFGHVRVHTDAKAAESARAVNALAYTVGRDIVMKRDEYAPATDAGKRLLAHELVHVIQQGGNNRLQKLQVGAAGDVYEQEADRVAERVVGVDRPVEGGGVSRHFTYPTLAEGKRLLTHEPTHVMQQSHSVDLIQRLIRTPYPWRGIIVPAIGANIRSSPNSTSPANILDSIPRGQIVNVISSSGNWLQVESRYRGPLLVGYVHNQLVDDATSSSMAASVGTTMVWQGSGPGSGTDFESWASAAVETPFPAVTSTTVMNCWEAVLLSAYRAGAIDWNWIHNLYVLTPTRDWVATMSRGPRHTYSIPGPNPNMPQRGDLVFFNGLAHVALATGNKSEVYTFWPPPNTPFSLGGTSDKVKIFTIEDLVSWWAANMPPQPTVEFSAPAW